MTTALQSLCVCPGFWPRPRCQRSSLLSAGQPPEALLHQRQRRHQNRGSPGQRGEAEGRPGRAAPEGSVVRLTVSVLSKVKGHYFLIVEAWDGAVDPRRSRLTLSVTVLDVDDNSPVFAQRSYNVSIPENSPKDKVILQLRVSGGCMGGASCRSVVVSAFSQILS